MACEEPHIVAALIELCREIGVRMLVQVGAEDGYEAAAIRKAAGCRAVAIEADYKCDPHDDTIEYHRDLIGAADRMADFYVNTTSGLSSTYSRGTGHEEKCTRMQRRLDTFCAYYQIAPDALIIDVEGATLDVLNGASKILGGVNMVYAEATAEQLPLIDAYLSYYGMHQRLGLPSYHAGEQGNYTWVRL